MACGLKKSMSGGATMKKTKTKTMTKSKAKKSKLGPNQGYCVKCKGIVTMVDGVETTFTRKGGKTGKMMKGKCPKCGTTVNRILGSK